MRANDDYIWVVENAVPDKVCEDLRRFIDSYASYAERSHYGRGENTNCRNLLLFENAVVSDPFFVADHAHVLAQTKGVLTALVNGVVRENIRPLIAPAFSPIQMRKMLGPTRIHFDNVSPTQVASAPSQFSARIVTFILTLSDSNDELVFPKQNRTIPLTKGSAVLFPPYWMYEHYTQTKGEPAGRYSVTTWLNEVTPAMKAEMVSLAGEETSAQMPTAPIEETTVFRMPESLRQKWWNEAAKELLSESPTRTGFKSFTQAFNEFAKKRRLPLCEDLAFNVLVRSGENPSAAPERLTALVNLSDEATEVRAGDDTIALEPGDGCWVPEGVRLAPVGGLGLTDLEVWLTLTRSEAERRAGHAIT